MVGVKVTAGVDAAWSDNSVLGSAAVSDSRFVAPRAADNQIIDEFPQALTSFMV